MGADGGRTSEVADLGYKREKRRRSLRAGRRALDCGDSFTAFYSVAAEKSGDTEYLLSPHSKVLRTKSSVLLCALRGETPIFQPSEPFRVFSVSIRVH